MLVMVTVCDALVVPTVCAEKVRLVGAKLTGRTAVPVRFNICCATGAVSVTTAAPLIVPLIEGAKVTLEVQLAPAARAPVQGVVPLATAVKLPLAVSDEMVNELALTLVTVTDLAALVVPTSCAANVKLVGLNVSGEVGPDTPVPESVASCGVNAALCDTVTAPLMAPLAVGLKVTDIVHLASAARLVLHGVVPLPTAV